MKKYVLYLLLLILLIFTSTTVHADGKLDSVEWSFEQDYEPLDIRSEFDTISLKVTVSNTSPTTESFRILFELIEKSSPNNVKDWMYGGPTYIGGWTSHGDMAEPGFLDTWGEVQNTLPIPPFESHTYHALYTLSGPPQNADLEIRVTLYTIEGTLLDRFDSKRNSNLGFTLLSYTGPGELPQDAQGWINTNKPTYTDNDTIVIEYAIPSSNKDALPTYQSSWDNAMIEIYDITGGDILVDSYPLRKAKERPQDYQEWGETGGKSYSISKLKDGFPVTNYLTLNPVKIGKGLIEGHAYEVALKNKSGKASYNLPFDILDIFTYLGTGEPYINLETSIEKVPPTPNNPLPIYNYNIAYSNTGFGDAYEVVIADNVPAESTYVKSSASQNSIGTNSISPNRVQFFDGIIWSNTEPSDPALVKSIRWIWNPNVVAANDNRDNYGPDEGLVSFQVQLKPGMTSPKTVLGTASVTYRSKDEPSMGIAQVSTPPSSTEQKQGVITFDRTLSGDKVGQHKAPPTTQVEMTIIAESSGEVTDAVLTDYLPKEWIVTDSKGGMISQYSHDYNQIVWQLGTITGKVTKSYIVMSPPLIIPPVKYYFQTGLEYRGGFAKSDEWMVMVSDPVSGGNAEMVPHNVIAKSAGNTFTYYIKVLGTGPVPGIIADELTITVHSNFSNVSIAASGAVKINGTAVTSYTRSVTGNVISIISINPTAGKNDVIDVTFTADAPTSPDATGVEFTSTIEGIATTTGVNVNGNATDGDNITVTTSSGNAAASAVAEITPTSVTTNIAGQSFTYSIFPTFDVTNTGVNQIKITVPSTYSSISMNTSGAVTVAGSGVTYTRTIASNVITIDLTTKVTTSQVIAITFTATTPSSADSGTNFTSTVDDTGTSTPGAQNASSGDGDNGGNGGSWTVTASASNPAVTSAVAEITPTSVIINTSGQSFTYSIFPTIGASDTGVNQVKITVPSTYSSISMNTSGAVTVAGSGVPYTRTIASNVITVDLTTKVTGSQVIAITFTATTPSSADSGTNFTSTIDDTGTSTPGAQSASSGDGDNAGNGGSWTITASASNPAVTSVVAEITPTSVITNTTSQSFTYSIFPTIGASDTGVNQIKITVPSTYSSISMNTSGAVTVAGSGVPYTRTIASNVITVDLTTKVTGSQVIAITFTATTPSSADSGTNFTSTVDDTGTSTPGEQNASSGDGDNGGNGGSWTVTASASNPAVTSAVAEISPTSVITNTTGQSFTYSIFPTVGSGTGINQAKINVPSTYSSISVTSVKVGGVTYSTSGNPATRYTNNSTGNTITIDFTQNKTGNSVIEIKFTATTPSSGDSGVNFTSTVDDTGTTGYPAQNTTEGDGDNAGNGGSWKVTASASNPAVTSAVAEITPNNVIKNSTDNSFTYSIFPTIGSGTGVNQVKITVPSSYTNVQMAGSGAVTVGGSSVEYTRTIVSGVNTVITVVLSTKVTTSQVIAITFTANAPSAADSGLNFTSTVDDTGTASPGPQNTTEGDGANNGTPNSWKVTTSDAGQSVTSAAAEITPNAVGLSSANTFTYSIFPQIGASNTGVDEITISVPSSHTSPSVTGVKIDGSSVSFTNNSSGNTIRVTLGTKVTTNNKVIAVTFTATAPSSSDSGVNFTSTVDDTSTSSPGAQNTTEGDGDNKGDGGDWTVFTGQLAVTSALAEISPNSITAGSAAVAFTYDILPTIGASDTGIDQVNLNVPSTYSNISLTGISVGGTTQSEGTGPASRRYSKTISGNVITITFAQKKNSTGTIISITFTADAPTSADSGRNFTSTLDDTSTSMPAQNTTAGNADSDASDNNSITVTATAPVVTTAGTGSVVATDRILAGGTIYVRVRDTDLKNGSPFKVTMVRNTGVETEELELTESPAGTGIFTNTTGIPTVGTGPATDKNGSFRVSSGDTIVTTYTDASPVGSRTATTKVVSSKTSTTGSVSVKDSTYTSSITAIKPADTLYIEITDSDLNNNSGANNDNAYVTVTTKNGDSETIFIKEDSTTANRFRVTLTSSSSSTPTTNNGNLELTGGDSITVTYVDSLDANDLVNQSRTATVLVITGTGIVNIVEIAISPGDTLNLEVLDADLSGSVGVTLTTTNGDSETVTLNETSTQGVFKGTFSTVKDTAKTGNGTLDVQEGDTITLIYNDANPKAERKDACIVITISGTGVANILEGTVFPGDIITGLVADSDLNLTSGGSNDTVSVKFVTSDANNPSLDDETLILNETTTPGLFTGTITTTESFAVFPSNGTLEVIPDDVITLEYTDVKDLEGKKNQSRTDSITVSKKPAEVKETTPKTGPNIASLPPTPTKGIAPTSPISGKPTTTQPTTTEQVVESPTTVATTRTETQTTTQQAQTAQSAQITGTQTTTTTQIAEPTYTPPPAQAEVPPPVVQQSTQTQAQAVTRAPGIAGTQPPVTEAVAPPPQYEVPSEEVSRAQESVEETGEVPGEVKPGEKPPVEEAKKVEAPVIERLPELVISDVESIVLDKFPSNMPSVTITDPTFTTDSAMYCSSEFLLTGMMKLSPNYDSLILPILIQKSYEYSLANIKWASKDSSVQKPEKITSPGSLGSSLIAQVLAAREYISKSDLERFLGLEMSNKAKFILDRLFYDGKSIGSLKDKPNGYIPHRIKVIEKEGKLNLEVSDKSSHLIDYAYLIWGLSEYLGSFKMIHSEGDTKTREELLDLSLAIFNNIKARHYDIEMETLIDINDGKQGTKVSLANTALTIVGLASFYETITDPAVAKSIETRRKGTSRDVKTIVIKAADFIVHKLQEPTGEFYDGKIEKRLLRKEGSSISKDGLLIQASGIRGLLAAWYLTGDKKYLEAAKNGFDYMDKNFWDDAIGIYKSNITSGDYTYTPLNVGMVVGTLREMSKLEDYTSIALSRLSRFFDRIVEDAGLASLAPVKNIIREDEAGILRKTARKESLTSPLLNSEVKFKQPAKEPGEPEIFIYDLAKSSITDKIFAIDSGMFCSSEFYLTGMIKPLPVYEWDATSILTKKAKIYAIGNINGLLKRLADSNKAMGPGNIGAGLMGESLVSGKLYIHNLIKQVGKDGKLNLQVSDKPGPVRNEFLNGSSNLTDYAYLAWGLGDYLKICPPDIKAQAKEIGNAIFSYIRDKHYDSDMATLIDISDGKKGSRISMSNASLSIIGLSSLYNGTTNPDVYALLIKEADFIINKLQQPTGEFSDGYWVTRLLRKEGSETSKDGLLIQASGIRGLLAAWNLTGDSKYLEAAKKGFDYMDKTFWNDTIGIYKSSLTKDNYAYTPLNVGMTVGALREMSNIEAYRNLALSRLSIFFDRIVEDAGLQAYSENVPMGIYSKLELVYPLNKGTGKLSASVSDTILYKISVQNTGIEPARDIVLKVTLPEGVYLSKPSDKQTPYTWQITELQPNKSFTITFQAEVKEVKEPGEKEVLIEINKSVTGGTPVTIKSTTQKLSLSP